MVHATGMNARGLHWNGLVVGRSPVEDAIVLTECDYGAGAEQHRECTQTSHCHNYWRGEGQNLANSQERGYGGT